MLCLSAVEGTQSEFVNMKLCFIHHPLRQEEQVLLPLHLPQDCLPRYRYRFGILQSPNCIICSDEVMLDAHHLLLYPSLSSNCISGRYWETTDLKRTLDTSLTEQLTFESFYMPFAGQLTFANRTVDICFYSKVSICHSHSCFCFCCVLVAYNSE